LKEGIEEKYPKLYDAYLNIQPREVVKVVADEDLRKEVEELRRENVSLKAQALENADLKVRISNTEEKLEAMEKLIKTALSETA